MSFKDFTTMPVWQNAMRLLIRIYDITNKFPTEEKYGLTSDIRRAANSVCHNLAEGYGRFENKDKSRFYKISRGSAYEIISQTMASQVLHLMSIQEKDELIIGYQDVIDQLDCLTMAIEKRKQPQSKYLPPK
ncbi:MAG: four helix bundle protein [Saprospiraceae bacterium]|uniref:Four helix bundle protein n=1 Tax=Candidatus Opimibacter skivensis TaxID=2982028 RepID=A0A9D7XPF5_9BACT|nr:four helix bundle protein [Candidatus Opimibacter skivensis]